MTIKKPIPITFNLDSHNSVQSVCAVIHIDDKNTETLDLSLMQGGEHIAVSPNSTVTARFVRVKNNTLISDDIACTVQENGNIYIPIDNAAAHMLVGEIKIEVNIVDENDILTMQFPLVIRVNNTILADAEISPESEGTIPELLEEAREAAESATQAAEAATEAISKKQDKLTAGDNITISEENVISASSGSNDYTDLTNKPSINNVTLSGNKSSDDLSLQDKLTAGENITIDENNVISAAGGVTDYEDLSNIPIVTNETSDIPLKGKFIFTPFKVTYSKYHDAYFFKLDRDDLFVSSTGETSIDNFDYFGFNLNLNHGVINCRFTGSSSSLPDFMNPKYNCFTLYNFKGSDHSVFSQMLIWVDATTDEAKMAIRMGTNGVYSLSQWKELTGGGSQIVSGVVNANGTITFTDSEGNSFTTSGLNLVTSGNEQVSMGYDEGGFYFLFDDGQEEVNNGTD